MAIKERFRKFGNRYAFEFLLETTHDKMIEGLRNYLSSIKAEDMASMVRSGKFPPLEQFDFSVAGENIEHIEKISLLRLMKFIAEARPDLATTIQDMGEAGGMYMGKLRAHLLNKMRQSSVDKEFKPKEDTVMAHCDVCDKSWPVKKEEAGAITQCPFCGAGGEEKKGSSSDEEEQPPEEE